MKKLNNIVRGTYNRYFTTIDESITFPLNLDYLDYRTKIDLDARTYAEYEENPDQNLPTLYELVASGKLIKKMYVEECTLNTFKMPAKPSYKKWMEYFKERGFEVSREALKHNYNAWFMGSKSGYLDEDNNYFLFTPCWPNELQFHATRLDKHFDWQETYGNPYGD